LIPKHTEVTAPEPVPPLNHRSDQCRQVNQILSRVGDKWSILVVVLLSDGPRRFNEIKRLVDGVSQRMLSLTLKGLERDGLVTRTVFPTIPPRVDYELTPLGLSLQAPVKALGQWALSNQSEIQAARLRFDLAADQGAPGFAPEAAPARVAAE
jgi:DNA-binding HxlR family transcriptional regulator